MITPVVFFPASYGFPQSRSQHEHCPSHITGDMGVKLKHFWSQKSRTRKDVQVTCSKAEKCIKLFSSMQLSVSFFKICSKQHFSTGLGIPPQGLIMSYRMFLIFYITILSAKGGLET